MNFLESNNKNNNGGMQESMPDPLLRARLWGNISRQLLESNDINSNSDTKREIIYSDEFQNCLVECVWQQIESIGKQLEILCHHRESNTINSKDLDTLYLLRRQ